MTDSFLSRETLSMLKTEGHGVMSAADAMGVSHAAVHRACEKHQLRLNDGRKMLPIAKLRHYVDSLPASEAIEHLLFVIGEMSGQADDEVCRWPEIPMTGMMRATLMCLYKNEGRTVSKDAIAAAIYLNRTERPDSKIIDVYVHKLRAVLGATGLKIRTDWGVGYKLVRAPGTLLPWECPHPNPAAKSSLLVSTPTRRG